MNQLALRIQILREFGAAGPEIEELLQYTTNRFDHAVLSSGQTLPLDDEPFITVWQEYAEEAQTIGAFAALQKHLPQFHFPIAEGISATIAYQQAVKRGIWNDEPAGQVNGLCLIAPERIHLHIHQTLAGKIPILVAAERDDFVTLLRAFSYKNEPYPIPASQGAAMLAGYNNWDRIRRLKRQFQQKRGTAFTEAAWEAYFSTIFPQKTLYQDKLILLSRGYYSGVAPEDLGLTGAEWREQSLVIRREHECTHYLTKRLLGSMQNNLLDELIADCAGLIAATGYFRADWFLRFVGLEHYPAYREGGRLQNYRGIPPLSDRGFRILQRLVYHAAHNLEATSRQQYPVNQFLFALTRMTLEELAYQGAQQRLAAEMLSIPSDEFSELQLRNVAGGEGTTIFTTAIKEFLS